MAEGGIEMDEFGRDDVDQDMDQETNIDQDINLDNLPEPLKTNQEQREQLYIETNVSKLKQKLKITGRTKPEVYIYMKQDKDGNIYYKNKVLTFKRGGVIKFYAIKTLLKSTVARDFLELIGYEDNTIVDPKTRDEETVAPEQTEVIRSKLASLKTTEEWAKKEKNKAIKQLQETTDENERQQLEENIQYFDQIEIQARRRYNEVEQNQFKRMDAIIKDKTRSLGERLKELFRRDGLTIGAIITAIGMTISTIVMSLKTGGGPPTPNNNNSYVDKIKAATKKALVKLANFLLDMAKKALTSLPGVIAGLVSTLLKKGAELVLFLSEHLIILLLVIILGIFEFFFKLRNGIRKTKKD